MRPISADAFAPRLGGVGSIARARVVAQAQDGATSPRDQVDRRSLRQTSANQVVARGLPSGSEPVGPTIGGLHANADGSLTTLGGYTISKQGRSWVIVEPTGEKHTIGPRGKLDGGATVLSQQSTLQLGDGTKLSFRPQEQTLIVQHGAGLAEVGDGRPQVTRGGRVFDARNDDGQTTVLYRGFAVDVTGLANAHDRDAEIGHIETQLDIVMSVGLPESVVAFMRTVPMTVDLSSTPQLPGTPALYQFQTAARAGQVKLNPTLMTDKDDQPVLLHELMHAFHDQQLPDGKNNQTVTDAWNEAKSIYPAGAYMLKNQEEYFAMTTTAYLFGHLARPPSTRANVLSNQPEYAAFLAGLFGERAA